MAKRIAAAIGLATLVAMATIVTGCEMKPVGTEDDPIYVQCSDN